MLIYLEHENEETGEDEGYDFRVDGAFTLDGDGFNEPRHVHFEPSLFVCIDKEMTKEELESWYEHNESHIIEELEEFKAAEQDPYLNDSYTIDDMFGDTYN